MPESVTALRQRLLTMLEPADAPGLFVKARAENAYRLRSIRATESLIAVVLKGCKRVHQEERQFEVTPAHAIVIAAGSRFDVENIPDSRTGEYLAALIVLPEEVLTIARALFDQHPGQSTLQSTEESTCSLVTLESIATELQYCIECSINSGQPRLHHALLGLLLKLYESGVTAFLPPGRQRLADTVGALFASEPTRNWRSIDVESQLAMSSATLRRQLAAERTSLRKILIETRLERAVQLLQTTRLPVKTVASQCGYRSISSFVRRFHQRYGVEPSRLANTR